ncbi:uncharacterized protein ACHE_60299S [Aspergillus chevalieri]|uniref:Phosphotyrosine protein phosphatase I domain-containing protein n=1 Tax=Aspergillus chevalieri TaxID=182096 RepID=A0A7R7VUI8_ASPCH|nr:uncharacterized protein ACHE_60299S [Aspergillus chevalieri]BCR90413.1 hypothetical protein ACHE_60299S [Aspergillus chevalieri]
MVHKPTVLFLCIHNAGRSQITAAYLTHLTNDNTIQVHSTGSAPVPSINPIVMQAIMKKESTSRVRDPKLLTHETVEECDVVTMGCGDACPYFSGKGYVDWRINYPAGQGIEGVRRVRGEIQGRVEGLIEKLRALGEVE